jgi:hypothetical protein
MRDKDDGVPEVIADLKVAIRAIEKAAGLAPTE